MQKAQVRDICMILDPSHYKQSSFFPGIMSNKVLLYIINTKKVWEPTIQANNTDPMLTCQSTINPAPYLTNLRNVIIENIMTNGAFASSEQVPHLP